MLMRALWLVMEASRDGIRVVVGELKMTRFTMIIPVTTTPMRAMVPTTSVMGASPGSLYLFPVAGLA
jgi:hypothetical protein